MAERKEQLGIRLSRRELRDLIERECQREMGMSRREFVSALRQNKLAPNPAVLPIAMLLRLGR